MLLVELVKLLKVNLSIFLLVCLHHEPLRIFFYVGFGGQVFPSVGRPHHSLHLIDVKIFIMVLVVALE